MKTQTSHMQIRPLLIRKVLQLKLGSVSLSVSPVVAGDGGYSTSPCTLQLGDSALHSFGGTSHPGSS